jgi:predicted deacylase
MRSLPDLRNEPPRVRADVDFDKAGKQSGYIRVPRPHTHSGLGVCGIPVVVVRNGTGPTFLLTGGTHGDEYDSQIALMELARELDPARVQGRIIIIPCLDLPAVEAGQRLCPIDNRDLNRVFPGNRNGTFTEMLADYVTRVLLPITDYNMDLHTGGNFHTTALNTCSHFVDDAKQMRANIEIGLAWGAPYHAVLRESDHTNSFMTIADRLGVPALSSELGGLARISADAQLVIRRGLRNMLRLHGAIEGALEKPEMPTRLMGVTDPGGDHHRAAWWAVPRLPCRRRLGEGGREAGLIYDFRDPLRPPTRVSYKASGCLWAMHSGPRVEQFDVLAVVMNEIGRAELGL